MIIKNVSTQDYYNKCAYIFIVGENKVKEIIEHRAQGEGDKWYYDIICEDGNNVRLFDFYAVGFQNEDDV